jgi:biopolymer transport protein ExbB
MLAATSFWVDAGGPIVLVLALLSLVSLAVIAVKAMQVVPARRGGRRRAAALAAWEAGATAEALAELERGKSPVDRVARVAMAKRLARRREAALRAEVELAGAAELDALGSHIRLLEIIAAVAPLLGLLGTVLGMIEAFRALELAGGAATAAVLAGGVWTALVTTAMGLVVAIPAGVAAGLLAAGVDRTAREMEATVARVFAADRADAA